MIIRWLGAFGKNGSVSESIDYEMKPAVDLRCAEIVKKGARSRINRGIGLLVKNRAVVRSFSSDVYSVRDGKRLRQTRSEGDAYSAHTEAWVRLEFIGIVVKSKSQLNHPIPQKILLAVAQAADKHNLPVFRLRKNGTLEEVVLKLR